MFQKCSRGHWFETDGNTHCPQCAVLTQKDTSVTDDDVLAIIEMPTDAEHPAHHSDNVEKPMGSNSAISRRKKICPECSHEASYSFVYCPRCGAPLKLVSVELH
jgi:hypothetical protein